MLKVQGFKYKNVPACFVLLVPGVLLLCIGGGSTNASYLLLVEPAKMGNAVSLPCVTACPYGPDSSHLQPPYMNSYRAPEVLNVSVCRVDSSCLMLLVQRPSCPSAVCNLLFGQSLTGSCNRSLCWLLPWYSLQPTCLDVPARGLTRCGWA